VVWKVVARSAIGTSHQQQQLPCQDYGGNRILNEVIVGAVADGAGSARYADLGAKLAVETTLKYLTATEAWFKKRRHSWHTIPQPPSEQKIRNLFAKIVVRVQSALQKQAIAGGYSVEELACTLIAFLATPEWIAAMQIGDGFIVVRCSMPLRQGVLANDFTMTGKDYHLLFQPNKGEYANQTTFVTSAAALQEMQVRVLLAQQNFICAATDGLERVAIRIKDWTPFPPFFQPLEEYLEEISDPEQEDAYLIDFLESDRLSDRTDDDKTLLLCLYHPEP
jgi:hypothetical protein